MEVTKDNDWRPPIGTRVFIKPAHKFHGGKSGTVIRHDEWLGKLAVAVRCDDGLRAGILSLSEIEIIIDGHPS